MRNPHSTKLFCTTPGGALNVSTDYTYCTVLCNSQEVQGQAAIPKQLSRVRMGWRAWYCTRWQRRRPILVQV